MRRRLLIILAAIITFGPALSILYFASTRWARPAEKYPDFHATWAIVSILCGYVGLVTALDLVLQVLRPGRRLSHSVWLCGGTAAGCVAGFLSLWMMWLTPWCPWLLIVNGLALTGLFVLLRCCRCRFELSLFGWVFAVAGLALFVFALREVYASADMADWVKTEGKITDSGGWQSRASKFLTRTLTYEYTVDGQQYTGREDTWRSTRMRYGWGTNLDRVVSSYGWSEKVAVYYDPSRPTEAVLRPGLSYATAFVVRTSLLSIVGGLILLVAAAQIGRTSVPVPPINGTANAPVERLAEEPSFSAWTSRIAFAMLTIWGLSVLVYIRPIPRDAMKVARIPSPPVTADGFCHRGLDLLLGHDPQRAFNNFTRALRLDPNHAAVYYDRGHACAQMGQVAQAVEDWHRAIQHDWHLAFEVYYAHRQYVPDNATLDRLLTEIALSRLSDLHAVSGYAVGYGGGPGEFYTASLILSAHFAEADFLRMAGDEKPLVRAMALVCLARRDIKRHEAMIRSLCNDTTEVPYMPGGCGGVRISLGALAKNILEDPNTLRYWDPEKTKWRWQRKESR